VTVTAGWLGVVSLSSEARRTLPDSNTAAANQERIKLFMAKFLSIILKDSLFFDNQTKVEITCYEGPEPVLTSLE
jgi:hypothetical protein